MPNILQTPAQSHHKAMVGVLTISTESLVTANLINVFRNIFPSVSNYVKDTIQQFKAFDETEFNFLKASSSFRSAESTVKDLNFLKFGETLLQTPEGFIGRYPEYIRWLAKDGIKFVNEASDTLGDYYRELSLFISSKEAKQTLKYNIRTHGEMQKTLEENKKALASFFDSRHSNALRHAYDLFDRSSDITVTIKDTEQLNRERLRMKIKEITSLTTQIAELLDMLVKSSEDDKIPEVSASAAKYISEGAMIAAYYVEFVGVLRYRIEEAINAVGIMAKQVVEKAKVVENATEPQGYSKLKLA